MKHISRKRRRHIRRQIERMLEKRLIQRHKAITDWLGPLWGTVCIPRQ